MSQSYKNPFELMNQVRCIKCRGLLSTYGHHLTLTDCTYRPHQPSPPLQSKGTIGWQNAHTGWSNWSI